MSDPALFWQNPTAVRFVALLAVGLLVTTIWLFRRQKRSGRGAAIVCLVVSIALHVAIVAFVPKLSLFFGGAGEGNPRDTPGDDPVSVAVFDSQFDDQLSTDSLLSDQLANALNESTDSEEVADEVTSDDSYGSEISPLTIPEPIVALDLPVVTEPPGVEPLDPSEMIEVAASGIQASLAASKMPSPSNHSTDLDDVLGDWLADALAPPVPAVDEVTESASRESSTSASTQMAEMSPHDPVEQSLDEEVIEPNIAATVAANARAVHTSNPTQKSKDAVNPGAPVIDEDFASRLGNSKSIALQSTGGDANTEAAVAKALAFLAENQRSDGAWDPIATGAGRERAPLGLTRGAAGKRAATGITGLALLSLLGSGNTHQNGDYQQNVYRGLAYLLGRQRPNGSLAGDASVYAAHYCHAMAALAIAEAAAMTGDAAALEATRRAISYSRSTQHPTTGGWRYTRGDRGDLSQLGWQAMLIDAAVRSGAIGEPTSMQSGVARFLDSVRSGANGGYACYRPGEGPTATMTAEALATRLLIGQKPSLRTIREAESVLMSELPGSSRSNQSGLDNYYNWYYATIALHQLQDDAWVKWNEALKRRLLPTQRPDGSWPDATLWGGYGGTVYSTSMATLCLETYYRHSTGER